MSGPNNGHIARFTDKYFLRTKSVVERFGDVQVTYAVFMRRPVLFAPRLALGWLTRVLAERGVAIEIEQRFKEGDWVGAGEPMMYLTGSLAGLVDLETILL